MAIKKDIGDVRVMRWIVPCFGLIIPNLSGLFGDLSWRDWQYWVGYLYFIAAAFGRGFLLIAFGTLPGKLNGDGVNQRRGFRAEE